MPGRKIHGVPPQLQKEEVISKQTGHCAYRSAVGEVKSPYLNRIAADYMIFENHPCKMMN